MPKKTKTKELIVMNVPQSESREPEVETQEKLEMDRPRTYRTDDSKAGKGGIKIKSRV